MIYMLHFFLGGGVYKDDKRIGTVPRPVPIMKMTSLAFCDKKSYSFLQFTSPCTDLGDGGGLFRQFLDPRMILLTDLEFYYSNVILCLNCLLLFIVTSIANLLRHDKYMM